jgi:hypothetical protein
VTPNSIDFFAPESERLALPAATITVDLDGVPCGDLEPVELVRSSWPEFGWARLAYNPSGQSNPERMALERLEDRFGMGRTICLSQCYSRIPPGVATAHLPVFVGQIEGMEVATDGGSESVAIVARDYSAVLRRITVYGRHVLQGTGSTSLWSGLETTFNPGGQANASVGMVTHEGKTYAAFCANAAAAASWGCAEVMSYLLGAYLPTGCLYWPGLDQLRALTDRRRVRDLDVTGLSLLEALHRCCLSAGLQFQFAPRLVETGPRQAIVFYPNGRGRTVELNCQPVGDRLSVSRTNIAALRSAREFYPSTHRYIGQGDFKTYEATFELVKAWDPALEETDYAKFSPSTNAQFYQVRDVFRKWCLNEAGDYTAAPYSQGEPFNFSKIFDGASHLTRRRRFWPSLSTDKQGRSLGYVLEVSWDDGMHWWEYVHGFNNLMDECGVWLSSDQLDVNTWVAAMKDGLRFRITASVLSDERLTCIVADGPVGSTVPVVDHVMTLPRQFRYRKVTRHSALSQVTPEGLGQPDEVDDTDALGEFVHRHAEVSGRVFETTDIQTPALVLHVWPGDRVTSSPDSRDLLSTRRDNRSLVWIDRVQVDFRKQRTGIRTCRQRI